MPDRAVFLFGTLRHGPLLSLVAGRTVTGVAATLAGYSCEIAMTGDWPVLVKREGARAEGLLIRVDAGVLARLDFYEAVFGYARHGVTVEAEEGPVAAEVWRPGEADPGRGVAWDLDARAAGWAGL
ncbi:MAG: gamma-glutamylcyclotransferase family protein, partial [Roseicyclus sp.]